MADSFADYQWGHQVLQRNWASGGPVECHINRRLTTAIRYHDTLNGFRTGNGTVTATLKAMMLQQIPTMSEAVLHTIFLDLHKLYGFLYWYRCIGILEGYGMGPRTLQLL